MASILDALVRHMHSGMGDKLYPNQVRMDMVGRVSRQHRPHLEMFQLIYVTRKDTGFEWGAKKKVSIVISVFSTRSVWLVGLCDSADPKLLKVSVTGSLASANRRGRAQTPGAKPMPSAAEKYSLFELQFLACSSASWRTFSDYVIGAAHDELDIVRPIK